METINQQWLDHFKNELSGTSELRIISPFVSDTMVKYLFENWKGQNIMFITRYNLNDFAAKASSIKAIKRLVANNVQVKGIRDLHSKVYIFNRKSAIITSANFTSGGFFNNYEFGVITYHTKEVTESIDYFNLLWKLDSNTLSLDRIMDWEKELKDSAKPTAKTTPLMKDYGVSIANNRKYFVKFYGTGDDRASLSESVKDQVVGTNCYFAVTFPEGDGRRPRRYRDGDVVFIARMVANQDYAIFGKAIARAHNDKRDVASKEDIQHVSWKRKYPIYIRVHSGEFLNTTFAECPKLNQLMSDLKGECFASTKTKFLSGDTEINPKLSLRRRPDIELSEEGAMWMEYAFENAKNAHSLVPSEFIKSLYQGTPEIK